MPLGIALSIDLNGATATATATVQAQCPGGGSLGDSFGRILSGTVASDGTFTLSMPLNQFNLNQPTLTIKGAAPTIPGAPWFGSYSFAANGLACSATYSDSFQATAIQDVNGTYTGATSFISTGAAISLSANIQQGGILNTLGVASATPIRSALNGTLQISGFSCFTKGVMSSGILDGDVATMTFTMDDGSRVSMEAYLLDLNASRLNVPLLIVFSGQCSGGYFNPFAPLILQR